MKTSLLLGAVMALTLSSQAQPATPPGQGKKGEVPLPVLDRVTVERGAIDEAKLVATTNLPGEQAKGQALAALETLLTPLNEAKPNTAEWRLETAQRLLHVAEQIAREGKPENVALIVNRALQHLQVADTPAHPVQIRSAAKSLAGFIQERYLADETAARAHYDAAALLDPANPGAKEKAERLRKKDETTEEKARKGGN